METEAEEWSTAKVKSGCRRKGRERLFDRRGEQAWEKERLKAGQKMEY